MARGMRSCLAVGSLRSNVLLCDDERELTDALATQLENLGHSVTIARSCADTFAHACGHDYDALVIAPFLRDGSALVLPRALGIRRPRLVVLVSRLTDRLAQAVARRVGFDVQLTKIVDAKRLDRLLRASLAAALEAQRAVERAVQQTVEAPPPASEVGARQPR